MENHLNTNKIPTAEEFLSQTSMLNKKLFPKKTQDFDQAVDRMKEFAKLHVESALKEAEIAGQNNWGNSKKMKDAILNAYPLTNIK